METRSTLILASHLKIYEQNTDMNNFMLYDYYYWRETPLNGSR